MDSCIFCKIVAGQIPCYKIYEDDDFLGFLDIYPRCTGHSILIPKKHYRWVYDVPDFTKYWEATLKLTKILQKVLKPYFVTYVTHGLEIDHAHIHIMPRQKSETAFVPEIVNVKKEVLKKIAYSILAAL